MSIAGYIYSLFSVNVIVIASRAVAFRGSHSRLSSLIEQHPQVGFKHQNWNVLRLT